MPSAPNHSPFQRDARSRRNVPPENIFSTGCNKTPPFSGIAASCNNEEYQSAGEYGTPYARFTFKGTVTDAEAHSPQEGIRVISRSAEAPELTDTVYTDRAGAYLMEFEHIFPNVEKVELRADAQERENGILFEEARHTIIITEEDYTGRGEGSSWNHGTVTKSVDFALERKK